ncbi:MAG: AAA family ATPase [Nevskiales bacterium]
MYAQYFGLRDNPFSITPDPTYVFMSPRHEEALGHLLYGTGEDGGFVQLTGEVGTGKTTLIRTLLKQDIPKVDVALILNPRLTAVEFMQSVCDELRIEYPKDVTTLKPLVDALNAHLLKTHAAGRRTVLIIDEAQNLSRDLLEQVRLLTNLETERDKLLRIMLIGQPELRALLAREDLRQLAQRITARYHLLPLDRAQTAAYITHRIQVAGGHPDLFEPSAVRAIYGHTLGVPRLINVICDRALLGTYTQNKRQVDRETVARAAKEVMDKTSRLRSFGGEYQAWFWGAAGFAAVIVGTVVFALQRYSGPPAVAPPPPVVVAAPAPPPEPIPSPPPAPVLFASTELALPALAARWQLPPEKAGSCAALRKQGLRCLEGRGGWTEIRGYNLPVVLKFKEGAAVLRALDGDQAQIEAASGVITQRLTELDAAWDGDYLLLWRSPISTEVIGPGAGTNEIRWLYARLKAATGEDPFFADPPVIYGEKMGDWVKRFQLSRGLSADGVVGARTLLRLAAYEQAAGTPSLTGQEAR